MHVDFYPPTGSGPAAAADLAHRAVRLGYDGFFSAETAHDPFIPLALAARAEPGLTLGTAIAVAFPRSPMVVAQTAWDLAALSGGRFILGLGTQVKPHVVRRFSTPWTSASGRLRDYIDALRAIWRSFQTGEPLRFESDEYRFTLLTPFFDPGPIDHPDVPVAIAGVGPHLARLAGERCDGFHVHPLHTVRYLDEVVLPNIAEGAAGHGRTVDDVDLIATTFVVTGRDEAEMAAARRATRWQIAFYASTPTYAPVLDTHGWDFGPALRSLSRRQAWDELADALPDEVVDEVAIVAEPAAVGDAIRARYGSRLARTGFYLPEAAPALSDDDLAVMIEATQGR